MAERDHQHAAPLEEQRRAEAERDAVQQQPRQAVAERDQQQAESREEQRQAEASAMWYSRSCGR